MFAFNWELKGWYLFIIGDSVKVEKTIKNISSLEQDKDNFLNKTKLCLLHLHIAPFDWTAN